METKNDILQNLTKVNIQIDGENQVQRNTINFTGFVATDDPINNRIILDGYSLQNLSQVLNTGNSAENIRIRNLADPISAQDAATKAYVDSGYGTVFARNIDGYHGSSGSYSPNNIYLEALDKSGQKFSPHLVYWDGDNGPHDTTSFTNRMADLGIYGGYLSMFAYGSCPIVIESTSGNISITSSSGSVSISKLANPSNDSDAVNYSTLKDHVRLRSTNLTIQDGYLILPGTGNYRINMDTQAGAASDDLDWIVVDGGSPVNGQMIWLRTTSDNRDITVKHLTGNIYSAGTDFTIPINELGATYVYDGSVWRLKDTNYMFDGSTIVSNGGQLFRRAALGGAINAAEGSNTTSFYQFSGRKSSSSTTISPGNMVLWTQDSASGISYSSGEFTFPSTGYYQVMLSVHDGDGTNATLDAVVNNNVMAYVQDATAQYYQLNFPLRITNVAHKLSFVNNGAGNLVLAADSATLIIKRIST